MIQAEEQLDRLIDAVNADDRRQIAALTEHEPELASLVMAARQLHGLRRPSPAAVPTIAVASAAPRRSGYPLRALGGIMTTVVLLIVVGIGLSLALADARDRRTGGSAWTTPSAGLTATPTPSSPQPTSMPPGSSSSAWSAIVQPLTALKVGGTVALRPVVSGEYEADVLLYGIDQELPWPLALALARGSCATPVRAAGAIWLRQTMASGVRVQFAVARAWLDEPLVFIAWPESGTTPLACADLPVVAARARWPLGESPGAMAVIAPLPDWHVTGQARLVPNASGDFSLFVEVTAPDAELYRENGGPRLLWFVYQGSCDALQLPPGQRGAQATVLYKENPGVDRPGHQRFTFIIERQWATKPLALAAFGEGGGPLIACGDLPAPTSP